MSNPGRTNPRTRRQAGRSNLDLVTSHVATYVPHAQAEAQLTRTALCSEHTRVVHMVASYGVDGLCLDVGSTPHLILMGI